MRPVTRRAAGGLGARFPRTAVAGGAEPLDVTIDHGLGDLEVTVPDDVDVRVHVENGIGDVDLFGEGSDGGLFRGEDGDGRVDLVLTIDHSLGDVEVSRA